MKQGCAALHRHLTYVGFSQRILMVLVDFVVSLLLVVDPLRLCARSSRPPKVCPRTRHHRSAYPHHRLGDHDRAGAVQKLAAAPARHRPGYIADRQRPLISSTRPFCRCPASSVNRAAACPDRGVAVDRSISGGCFRGCQAGRAQAGSGRQRPSFRFARHPTGSHRSVRPERIHQRSSKPKPAPGKG